MLKYHTVALDNFLAGKMLNQSNKQGEQPIRTC
jgi:hypothetical protein